MPFSSDPMDVADIHEIGAIPPNRTHPLPLWAQVCDDLRRRIDLNEFSTGFPGELDLTEQYGVSRHTIREALRVLRAEGILKSERGRGTSLRERNYSQNLGALYSLFQTISEEGVSQASEVQRLAITTNHTVAQELGVDPHTELVVLERVRLANDEPLALDTSWLLASETRALLNSDFTTNSLYSELKAQCGIEMNGGKERINAQPAPRHIASILNMPTGVAVFAIERLGAANNRAIEWRETFIRGDRFTLEVDFAYKSAPSTSRGLYIPSAATTTQPS
jgi:GntR family transcriptional regulator